MTLMDISLTIVVIALCALFVTILYRYLVEVSTHKPYAVCTIEHSRYWDSEEEAVVEFSQRSAADQAYEEIACELEGQREMGNIDHWEIALYKNDAILLNEDCS